MHVNIYKSLNCKTAAESPLPSFCKTYKMQILYCLRNLAQFFSIFFKAQTILLKDAQSYFSVGEHTLSGADAAGRSVILNSPKVNKTNTFFKLQCNFHMQFRIHLGGETERKGESIELVKEGQSQVIQRPLLLPLYLCSDLFSDLETHCSTLDGKKVLYRCQRCCLPEAGPFCH